MTCNKGPWIVTTSRDVYHNKWVQVREDRVKGANDRENIFGVVTAKPGVAVLPIDKRGNVYLVEQYRYALETKTIEVVCGGINVDEEPLSSAKRELKEEVGIIAKKWVSIGRIDPLTSVLNSPSHLFIARDLTFTKDKQGSTESIKVIMVSFEQALEWVTHGTITHSPTIILILKTKLEHLIK